MRPKKERPRTFARSRFFAYQCSVEAAGIEPALSAKNRWNLDRVATGVLVSPTYRQLGTYPKPAENRTPGNCLANEIGLDRLLAESRVFDCLDRFEADA